MSQVRFDVDFGTVQYSGYVSESGVGQIDITYTDGGKIAKANPTKPCTFRLSELYDRCINLHSYSRPMKKRYW